MGVTEEQEKIGNNTVTARFKLEALMEGTTIRSQENLSCSHLSPLKYWKENDFVQMK